jgi:type I restriction enzyme S subunit
MKQYDSYKDSGVQWIGEIPSHWERCRFKDFVSLKTDSSSSDVKIGLENIEGKTGRYIETNTEFEGDGVAFDVNDIVYGKLRPYLQKVWLATFAGNAVGDFFVFHSKQNCESKYLQYLMLSDGFTSECNGATLGAKMPRVSSDFILTLRYFLPPFTEQQAIATYLDKKCAEIDKAIATQQKRIGLLQELRQNIITHAVTRGINPDTPLKDSGVEWIGEVPEHWEVMKMGLVCKVITDYVASGSFADLKKNVEYLDSPDYAMLVRTADLSNKNKDIQRVYVSKASYNFLSNSNLHGGEIILPNIGASIGDVYMVPDNLYEKMTLAPNSIMVKTKYYDMFYYYYFCSIVGRKSLELIGQAAAQGKFNKTELRQMRVPVPPLSEQQEMVTYIESKTVNIDNTIAKANHQISLLQELKQSIITELVTGKRKVC